ncbi:hypothetical protein [Algivirga pacifica]|uniref:Uncharacterized protein n=1 Tax=Algivirga pacifica TaxID=1162670 RepID=A0ABP9DK50_9BACT
MHFHQLKKLTFLVLILYGSSTVSHAQQRQNDRGFTDEITSTQYSKLIGSHYQMATMNDYNFIFTPKTNDQGYTVGLAHEIRVFNPKDNSVYEMSLTSDLYTEFTYDTYNIDNRRIEPQKFTEINKIELSYSQYIPEHQLFFSIATGIGMRNKERAVPGMALFMQGGYNGQGGYHRFIEQYGFDYIPTGGVKPFVFVAPSLTKHYIYQQDNQNNDPFHVSINGGIHLGSSQIQSNLFASFNSELPVVQFDLYGVDVFKFSIRSNAALMLHQEGFLFNPEVGTEVSLFFLKAGYVSTFNIGHQPLAVVDYFDNETTMRLYAAINL